MQVVIDKATTGGELKRFLEFLYTGKYTCTRNRLTDEDLQQLLQLAEHHKLTRYLPAFHLTAEAWQLCLHVKGEIWMHEPFLCGCLG